MDKIREREDKYQICEVISYKCNIEEIKRKINLYEAVVLETCLHMKEIYC